MQDKLIKETPMGVLQVIPKGATDEYPGFWIILKTNDGSEIELCMIEYDTTDEKLVLRAYADRNIEEYTDKIVFR